MMLPFALPPTAQGVLPPIWQGRGFMVDGRVEPVLEYSVNSAGWSDDLTELHENAAGAAHPIDVASRANAIAALRRHLAAGGGSPTILEIGCSSGFMLEALAREFPRAVLLGADVVEQPLLRLAERLPEVPLFRFDLTQCPLPSGICDAVILLNVLEHIEEDRAAIRHVYRLLKPGGVAIIEVPAGPHLYDAYDAALCHFRRYSMSELTGKLSEAGFVPLRCSHLGFAAYPAFRVAKWRGRHASLSASSARRAVEESARRTADSLLLRMSFKLDETLARWFNFPFGIRCLAVAEKVAGISDSH
jgi:SAM-dependent methyltransferase